MSNDEKSVQPDVVIQLTAEQLNLLQPLKEKQKGTYGMIIGSVGIERDGKGGDTIALSLVPHELSVKIRDLAYQELGGNNEI